MCPAKTHKIRVYSTATASENVARSSRRTIASCEHRDLSTPSAVVETHLDAAEAWLDAVSVLLDRNDAEEAMHDALEKASENISSAELDFDVAYQRYDEAVQSADAMAISKESVPAPLLVKSRWELRKAGLVLRDLPKQMELQNLRERLDSLKQRHSDYMLRTRST